MSLGIGFKGSEGIVLAADSRVTITTLQQQAPNQSLLLPSTFDNATKLLKIKGQEFVGAVTYGVGALGIVTPRTAHSFLPEFENRIASRGRLGVADFANELSSFFVEQWRAMMPAQQQAGEDIIFLVGGYDEGSPYGRLFDIFVPSRPQPKEWFAGSGEFGMCWGGQQEYVERLLKGYDPRGPGLIQNSAKLNDQQMRAVGAALAGLQCPIPYQFLPLQDCVDLSIFLIRTTIQMQRWTVGIRGVGGSVDVATITRADGFSPIQLKRLAGENPRLKQ